VKYVAAATESRTCRATTRGISLRRVPLTIYYDFTSAESFAIHEIARGHERAGEIEWCGVQVDETLPVPMMVLDRRARERLDMDLSDARKAWPSGHLELPRGMPNTRLALQAVASIERMHRTRAEEFRSALFRAFWHQGEDLSDIAVVRRAAAAAGVPPWAELGNQAAQGQQVSWELAWKTERFGGVPRVIRPDGQILWKVRSEAEARAFLSA
jgi:2-hydroxychromene-2-carboxylate isomerase